MRRLILFLSLFLFTGCVGNVTRVIVTPAPEPVNTDITMTFVNVGYYQKISRLTVGRESVGYNVSLAKRQSATFEVSKYAAVGEPTVVKVYLPEFDEYVKKSVLLEQGKSYVASLVEWDAWTYRLDVEEITQ